MYVRRVRREMEEKHVRVIEIKKSVFENNDRQGRTLHYPRGSA